MKKILTIMLSFFLLVGCTGDTKKSIAGCATLHWGSSTMAKQEDDQKEVNEPENSEMHATSETSSTNSMGDDTGNQSNSTSSNTGETSNKQNSSSSNESIPPSVEIPSNTTPPPTKPPVEEIAPTPTKQYVMVSIDCKTILDNRESFKEKYESFIPSNGVLLNQTKVEYQSGDTVLSVFKKVTKEKGIAIINQNGYISSIGHISERGMEDGTGGWMYLVNGSVASVGAGSYKLSANDTIQWRYTCIPGDI